MFSAMRSFAIITITQISRVRGPFALHGLVRHRYQLESRRNHIGQPLMSGNPLAPIYDFSFDMSPARISVARAANFV